MDTAKKSPAARGGSGLFEGSKIKIAGGHALAEGAAKTAYTAGFPGILWYISFAAKLCHIFVKTANFDSLS